MTGSAARWSLAALLLVLALVYAIWPRGDEPVPNAALPGQGAPVAEERRSVDTAESLAPLRERAQLSPCPTPDAAASGGSAGGETGGEADGPLAGIELECLGDGTRVDVAQSLAGRPALINLWAYWCAPCAEELPYLQQYAEQAAGRVTVLTVHQDRNAANGLARLADYGVHLPGVQDGAGRIAAAVGAPSVLPVSVLVRADGSVAEVLPRPFRSVAEIDEAVDAALGATQ